MGRAELALVVRRPDEDAGERELQKHARDYVDKGLLPKQVVCCR